MKFVDRFALVALVAPFWVATYVVAGGRGVLAVMLVALALEIVLWIHDLRTRRRHRAIALRRLEASR